MLNSMKSFWIASLLAAISLFLVGCGGTSGVTSRTSTVTGTVLDIDFNAVRDAHVRAEGVETYSSTSGAYQLTDIADGVVQVIAEFNRDGVLYRGRNAVLNFPNQQTNNCNIIVAPVNQLGRIVGNVKDIEGFDLEGASVFAFNGTGSSQRAFTDSNGNYVLEDLVGGVTYTLSAGGSGFSSDQFNVTVVAGQSSTANFTCSNAGLPGLTPPQNPFAVSWVSPNYGNRSEGNPYPWIKQIVDKRTRVRKAGTKQTRAIRDDLIVEVDLFWDIQQFPDLLGYGIYRSPSAGGSLSEYDFIAEPLAAYYVDIGPNTNATYSYALTTLATLYPDYNGTESGLSDRVVVETLNLLRIQPVTSNTTFNWSLNSGATEYVVYVFDEYPGVEVFSIWDNADSPTTQSSLPYTGPALSPGHTYYYVVVGSANGGTSRTVSEIGSFTP